MQMAGRPAAQRPKTAYDYRRVKTLVDVLAIPDAVSRNKGLLALADGWGVDPVTPWSAFVCELAQHAQQHAHNQPPSPALPDQE